HGGYGGKDDDFRDFVGTAGGTQFFVGGIDSRGWVFGGQAGYNWQHGPVVAGLEIDFSGTSIDGVSAPGVISTGAVTQTITRSDDWVWHARHVRTEFVWRMFCRLCPKNFAFPKEKPRPYDESGAVA